MEIKLFSKTTERIFLMYYLKLRCLYLWSLSFALRTSSPFAEEVHKIASMGLEGSWKDERKKERWREKKETEQKTQEKMYHLFQEKSTNLKKYE